MANYFLRTLFPLLSFTGFLLAAAELRPFKLDFLEPQNLAAGEYIYQGDAHMMDSPPAVRLTGGSLDNPAQYSVGRVVLSEYVIFRRGDGQLTFETVVKFRITPTDSNPAEGLAFFIAPITTTIPEGSAGGNLGVFSPNDGANFRHFAIEFDSGYNPGIDQTRIPHVGIDVQSPISVDFKNVGSAMIAQDVTATIRYDHAARLITVSVAAGNQIFELSHERDLSDLLAGQFQIGISASTGENVAFHDLLFWEFRKIRYDPVSPATTTQVV